MRNRKFIIFSFLASGLFLIAFSSSHPTGPNGYTGAPGDGVCNQCHSNASGTIDGDITINGLPATVTANSTYNLTITTSYTSGNPVRAGFQVLALNDANNANAGDWTNNSSNSSLKVASGKEYFGHQPAVMFGGNTSISWNADWTAPATNMDVTLYAVANLANGSGTGGDRIKYKQGNTQVTGAGGVMMCNIINDVGVSCFGADDGSAEIQITGGVSPYNILWDNGEVTAIATNLSGGMHTVVVTDDTNATCTQSIFINEPSDIITTINTTDVSCLGASDGSATINPSGGVPGYSYIWSVPGSGNSISNVPAGTYFATVTDATLCTDMVEVTIGGPTAVTIVTNTEQNVTCNGDANGIIDVSGSGGTPGYSYNWSNGGTSPTNSNLSPGNYTVVVTDQNMCTASESYTISEPPVLIAATTSMDETTAGANDGSAMASATGGTPPYDYLWNTGAITPSINNLAPNTYTVVVTDQNGCESTETATVNPGGCNLTLSLQASHVPCYGESSGSINLTVNGGTTSTSFDWSNGATSEDLNNIPAGAYTVIVTDGNCQETAMLTITQPDSIAVLQTTEDNMCNAATDGEIILQIEGGVDNYTLLWSNGLTNDSTFIVIDTPSNLIDTIVNIPDTLINLATGTYSYILSDGNGCILYDTLEIQYLDTIAPLTAFTDVNIYLDEDGVANPVFESDFIGASVDNCGIEQVNFVSGAFTCSDISQFFMHATLIDSSGNMSIDSFLVTVLDTLAPTISCSQSDIVINNCDAFFYIMPTATDNCAIQSLELTSGLASGSVFPSGSTLVEYTATDDCGYSSTCSFTVTVDIDFTAEVEITQLSCPEANDGSLTLSPTGGTPPYNYTIMPGNINGTINAAGDSIILTDLASGEYSVFVEDNATCNFSYSETIVKLPNLEANLLSITNESAVGANDGAIDIEVLGGIGTVMIEWTTPDGNPVGNSEDLDNLGAGTYIVTLSDNCEVFMASYEIDIVSSSVDLDAQSFNVQLYPNPASSVITLNTNLKSISKLEIYDHTGKKIDELNTTASEQVIDISHLNAGVYLLRLSTKEKIIVKPFVKL